MGVSPSRCRPRRRARPFWVRLLGHSRCRLGGRRDRRGVDRGRRGHRVLRAGAGRRAAGAVVARPREQDRAHGSEGEHEDGRSAPAPVDATAPW